jgi:hypothetical protein
MTSSAFSLTASVPNDGFKVLEGSPVIGGAKNPEVVHYMCPDCMSWLYTQPPGFPFTNIRLPMLEKDKVDLLGAPWCEVWTSEKSPWVPSLGAKYSFEKTPTIPEFLAVVADYQAKVAE